MINYYFISIRVGKTSVLNRFSEGTYTEGYKATIGGEFHTKELCING